MPVGQYLYFLCSVRSLIFNFLLLIDVTCIFISWLFLFHILGKCGDDLLFNIHIDSNSVDPDQTAPTGAI